MSSRQFRGYRSVEEKELLSWATRVKIAIGTAQGLAFIHSINNSSVYFELRMHNIMLDEKLIPKFGSHKEYNAKLFYIETNKKCLENQWTLGRGLKYMSTECIMSGWFEMDTDVFAFGVILLELFTGSKDGDLLTHLIASKEEARKLKNKGLDVIRTRPFSFTEIIDPRLEKDYPVNAAMQMSALIQRCTEDKHTRPSMQQVLDVLNHIAKI
uniref:Protein kinase domain-containing protein n=1 Tax=Brassica oleracea var. oleracea TaxID=109376 RepID=A0A0D3EG81_BRAOL